MRKRAALALMALAISFILFACASAEAAVPAIDEMLFSEAKQALVYFSDGEYEYASILLGFADADELEKFVTKNFKTIGEDVQTKVSVAYWSGNTWELALPLTEPDNKDVETLVLFTSDGVNFSGYQYATWGQVEEEYSACSYVVWNEEYVADTPRVIEE